MASFKHNIYLKILTIFLVVVLLLVPASMIESLVNERQNTQQLAIDEVSSKWANAQTLKGPMLSVPYTRYVRETRKDSTTKIVQIKEFLHILPTDLRIEGQLKPELRTRGIYEIVVYNSNIKLSGTFSETDFAALEIPAKDIQFDKATLDIGIDDLRGIERSVTLKWDDRTAQFNPGVESRDVIESGITASIPLHAMDSTAHRFAFDLDLKGSQMLYFTPVGKVTDVSIHSPWTTPSFNGAFLPDTRKVDDKGFSANWNVLHLNRNYPQMWSADKYAISESSFGIDLLLPVDNYQKTYRSIRYAILFIGFTFLTFFFIEILNKRFIHPIQYILVGIALLVFYTLLLSLSEHLAFNAAFGLSALATLLLIAGYVKAILKSNALTGLMTGLLLILYLFLFVVIQLEDLALLIGSIGVFVILALVMYYSRKIDWYNIQIKDTRENP